MKHSLTFNPVSCISGHPELMHLLLAAIDEEVIAKIPIGAFSSGFQLAPLLKACTYSRDH